MYTCSAHPCDAASVNAKGNVGAAVRHPDRVEGDIAEQLANELTGVVEGAVVAEGILEAGEVGAPQTVDLRLAPGADLAIAVSFGGLDNGRAENVRAFLYV